MDMMEYFDKMWVEAHAEFAVQQEVEKAAQLQFEQDVMASSTPLTISLGVFL